MNINCIIQSRLTSKRLPGKVFKKIGSKNLIEIIDIRTKKSKYIDNVIFAIPDNKKNIKLKNFLIEKKFKFFLGSEKNVLKRTYECAKKFNTNIVVRITSDCPLINHDLIDSCIKQFKREESSYLASRMKNELPDGLDVEVFDFKTLAKAYKNTNTKYNTEHVTSYIIKNPNIKKTNLKVIKKINYDNKLSIDDNSDYLRVKKVFKYFNNYTFSTSKLLSYLSKKND